MFLSTCTSSEQSYAGALCQDTQHQQTTGTADRREKLAVPRAATPAANRKFRKEVLTLQASSSSFNDMLKVATVVQQIITELSENVSEKRQNNGHYKNNT
jgi:hypothetical protein